MCVGRLWRGASFSIGASLGNMKGILLYRGLRDKGETLYQETLFVGESERYVKEGSGNGRLSP
jgi:hypothetical protein